VSEDPRANRRADGLEEITHRGVRWQRDGKGRIRFYDSDGGRWVPWRPGVDAPPVPSGWGGGTRPAVVERPPWRSRWRVIPVVLTIVVVVIAVVQALRPSGNEVGKEAAATAALAGKCLAQHGSAEGHPKYSATPVPCSAPTAAVRVAEVITSIPGSPLCPGGTTGVELPYAGVTYPHILCIQPVHPSG
jgi:hypothetical protein